MRCSICGSKVNLLRHSGGQLWCTGCALRAIKTHAEAQKVEQPTDEGGVLEYDDLVARVGAILDWHAAGDIEDVRSPADHDDIMASELIIQCRAEWIFHNTDLGGE